MDEKAFRNKFYHKMPLCIVAAFYPLFTPYLKGSETF